MVSEVRSSDRMMEECIFGYGGDFVLFLGPARDGR